MKFLGNNIRVISYCRYPPLVYAFLLLMSIALSRLSRRYSNGVSGVRNSGPPSCTCSESPLYWSWTRRCGRSCRRFDCCTSGSTNARYQYDKLMTKLYTELDFELFHHILHLSIIWFRLGGILYNKLLHKLWVQIREKIIDDPRCWSVNIEHPMRSMNGRKSLGRACSRRSHMVELWDHRTVDSTWW